MQNSTLFCLLRFNIKIRLTIIICFLNTAIHAQTYNIWAFSPNTKLDFRTEPPSILKIAKPLTSGGTASISDKKGSLLYYTFGNQSTKPFLANQDDSITYNSSFIKIGNTRISTYVSPLLISHSSDTNLIRFILGSAYTGYNDADTLSKIYSYKINRNANGGKGDILDSINDWTLLPKNVSHLSFINHQNQQDYWIIGRNCDTIYSFLLNQDGITNSFKQRSPHLINKVGQFEQVTVSGCSKFSNNARFLAMFTMYHNSLSILDSIFLDIHHFNNKTGSVLLKRNLFAHGYLYRLSNVDMAFSSNDSLLYITYPTTEGGWRSLPIILRYNLYSDRLDTVYLTNKYRNINNSANTTIQLGPNGKIYFQAINDDTKDRSTYLGVINNPNEINLNDLQITYTKIDSGQSNYRYVHFPHHDQYKFVRFEHQLLRNCSSAFVNKSDTTYKSFTWYFGDGDTSFEFEPIHFYATPGKYFVKLKGENMWGYTTWFSDTIIVKSIIAKLHVSDSIGCQWHKLLFQDSSLNYLTNTPQKNMNWNWDFGDQTSDTLQNPIHIYRTSGQFSIKLIVDNGFCIDTTQIIKLVNILPAPFADFNVDNKSICIPPGILSITDTVTEAIVQKEYAFSEKLLPVSINLNTHSFNHTYFQKGKYTIVQILKGNSGCINTDTQYVEVYNSLTNYTPNSPIVDIQQDKVFITWSKDSNTINYNLYKAGDDSHLKLFTQLYDTSFCDSFANQVNKKVYTYAIGLVDGCKSESKISKTENSILLLGKNNFNIKSTLSWNDINNRAESFQLVKSQNSFLENITTNTLSYTDFNFYTDSSQFPCYQIKVKTLSGAYVNSNLVCIPYTAYVFVPSTYDLLNFPYGIPIRAFQLANFQIDFFDLLGRKILSGQNISNLFLSDTETHYLIYKISGTTITGNSYEQIGRLLVID